jgi:hypothetical protein
MHVHPVHPPWVRPCGVWDPMPELTITSPYVHSRFDSNTFTMGNPVPESTLSLYQIRLYPPIRVFGFGSAIATNQEHDIYLAEWLERLTANAKVATVLRHAHCLVLLCDFLIYDIFMLF